MYMNNGYLIDKTESRVTLYVLKTISSRNGAYGFMTIVSQDTTVFFWWKQHYNSPEIRTRNAFLSLYAL